MERRRPRRRPGMGCERRQEKKLELRVPGDGHVHLPSHSLFLSSSSFAFGDEDAQKPSPLLPLEYPGTT